MMRRTKIVVTLGPASSSPKVLRQLVKAGMNVARLNFSHGSHDEHAAHIACLRAISHELDTPITILQDLQGPKIRVGTLPQDELKLIKGTVVSLVPEQHASGDQLEIPLDYPHVAKSAHVGARILFDDGLLGLEVSEIVGSKLKCRVIEGGILKSRKGVNLPDVTLPLPSLTEKDIHDVEFGLAHNVDWISLSFVRTAKDVRVLKEFLAAKGAVTPVIAKVEKPEAIANLDEILDEVSGMMVARGDLGVEVSPEKVPMLQKQIIEKCNRRGLPVITATQMLESMVHDPRPTRAEASDVANAIIDGTDALMLSAESAVGAYPIRAVEMMARIASQVEDGIEFKTYRSFEPTDAHALSEAATIVANGVSLRAIVVLTTTGYTARFVASQRSKIPLIALTTNSDAYHELNLFWGITPLLVEGIPSSFEALIAQTESTLIARKLAAPGDKILIIGGVPAGRARGSNFMKIHSVSA